MERGCQAGGGGRGRARAALFQAAADSSRSGMMPDPEPSSAFILNFRGDTSACPAPTTITTLAPPHPPTPLPPAAVLQLTDMQSM